MASLLTRRAPRTHRPPQFPARSTRPAGPLPPPPSSRSARVPCPHSRSCRPFAEQASRRPGARRRQQQQPDAQSAAALAAPRRYFEEELVLLHNRCADSRQRGGRGASGLEGRSAQPRRQSAALSSRTPSRPPPVRPSPPRPVLYLASPAPAPLPRSPQSSSSSSSSSSSTSSSRPDRQHSAATAPTRGGGSLELSARS